MMMPMSEHLNFSLALIESAYTHPVQTFELRNPTKPKPTNTAAPAPTKMAAAAGNKHMRAVVCGTARRVMPTPEQAMARTLMAAVDMIGCLNGY